MAQPRTIEIAGGVVYWQLGWTRRDALEQKFTALGLGKYTPAIRKPGRVLRHALHEQYQSARTLVRPLAKTRNGFGIVKEERGTERNDYQHQLTVRVDDSGLITTEGGLCMELDDIQSRFDDLRTQLSPNVVGKSLVDLIVKKLGGITLRDSGGVYWIQERDLPLWNQIVQAVESSAIIDGKSTIYTLQTQRDEQCIRAVSHAIVAEAEAAVQAMEAELQANDLGERAWESRVRSATRLQKKLTRYQEELGLALGNIAHQVDEVRERATMASLLASAESAKDGIVGADMLAKMGVNVTP